MNTVKILSYDPNWPKLFATEAQKIKNALGNNCQMIHHIGSTSIEGLSAKPIIDILAVVKDITKVAPFNDQMITLGYEVKGEYGLALRRYFTKRTDNIGFNVHVFEEHNTEINRHLNFTHWMRTHENDKKAYEHLKLQLAEQFPNDIFNYCMGKDAFVSDIDKKAGFNGYRMVIALMEREWQFFADMHHASDLQPKINKKTYTKKAQETHFPFVLYQGDKMIGAAHIEFNSDSNATLHTILLNTSESPTESTFYQLLTKWTAQFGRQITNV